MKSTRVWSMQSRRMGQILAATAMATILAPGAYRAATLEIHPGDSFEAAVESLSPGDILVVHAGTYADTGRISIGVRGTEATPVLIHGADGEERPLVTRPPSAAVQNTINIEGATHLTIRGLEITGNGGDGLNLNGNPSHITVEDLEIHDVDVGINLRSSMDHIVISSNHIHDTGINGGTGEGMYVGCNYSACVVRDSVIEGNWIHDSMTASQGDGIEIKRGSHSNVIRDNVIHDTHWPCILLYGTDGNPRNIVEGNALWNCGDSGIQAAADAVIRNNVILDSPGNGFNSQDHQEVTPNNLEFVHNTIVGGNPCLRLGNWSDKQGLILANNAVYCPSGNFAISGLTGVVVSGNVVSPQTSSIPSAGYTVGRSAVEDLIDPTGRDVYPAVGSALVDAANASYATSLDFNGTSRTEPPDAGAYVWIGPGNPGWAVGPGFKETTASQAPAAPAGLRAE